MYPLAALTSFLALTLARAVLASPLEELNERATATRVCTGSVVTQLSSCATRTAFCSRFLSAIPPADSRTSFKRVTVFSTTRTTATVTVATSTTTSDIQVTDCSIFGKREAAPSAALAAAPPGPSCKLSGAPPAQIENACFCQKDPQFTFKGKRPKPTTTNTVVITTTVKRVFTSTITTAVTATHTASSFKLFRDFGGTSNGERLEIFQSQVEFTDDANGTIFTQDPQNKQLWAAQLTRYGAFYTIFGQEQNGTVSPLAINSTSPNSPPNAFNMLPYPWVPLSISFGTQGQCPGAIISYPDGNRAYMYECTSPGGSTFIGISSIQSQTVCTLTGVDVQSPDRFIPD